MVRKKTEGNEEQRRKAARRAREAGKTPSALQETTGASKQRRHLPRHDPHEEKVETIHQGKQQWPYPEAEVRAPTGEPMGWVFTGIGGSDYGPDHERVFSALTEAQRAHDGEGVYLDEIARRCGMPREQVRVLLHDLTVKYRLVTELMHTDVPDLGPRFEVKPRAGA